MSRSLLAISWAMPPALFPRSLQVARSLSALAKRGWQSTVICSEPPANATVDWALKKRYEGSYTAIEIPDASAKPRTVWQRLMRRSVAAPKSEVNWVSAATEAAIAIAKSQNFDALITFAQPWSDHTIGKEVARHSRLPWIAHFSDPWADNPYINNVMMRAEALAAERGVVEAADLLVFPVERVANLVMGKYPSDFHAKVRVVPHGFEPRPRLPVRLGDVSRPMRLIHAGDFYGIRSPAPFIAALRELHARAPLEGKMEIFFIGSVPEEHIASVRSAGLERIVHFTGRVSNSRCEALLDTADALLVIDAPADESVFLPSKLIDYLPLGRPIVGLTPKSGASADLLDQLGCPIAEPDDIAAIETVLETMLFRWQTGSLVADSRFDAVSAGYDISSTTALLDAAIHHAVETAMFP